jgi:predicted ArsR family transcriptional regulator
MAGPDHQASVSAAPAARPSSAASVTRESRAGGPNGTSTLRRDILFALRRGGATSPEQLAQRLGASRTGVLQQLRSLQAAGLVDRRTVRHGVGRPRHLYDVTPDAQVAFPSNYDGLAAGLMAAIGVIGGDELVAEVFDARRKLLAQQMKERLRQRLPDGAPLVDRVRELAVIQDEQGYLSSAVIGVDGTIRLQQCNCAIYGIASASSSPCEAELQLFHDVLGAEVVRESHIASGDRSCTYRIYETNGAPRGS